MLDLDFIGNDKPSVKQSVLYCYDSLLFKPQTIRKLLDHFESKGSSGIEHFKSSDHASFLQETGLFGSKTIIIDLESLSFSTKLSFESPVALLEEISKQIANKTTENNLLVLLDKREDSLLKVVNSTVFETLKKATTFIESPTLNKAAVKGLVAHLIKEEEAKQKILIPEISVESITSLAMEVWSDNSDIEISLLYNLIDRILTTAVQSSNGAVDLAEARKQISLFLGQNKKSSSLLKAIADLVTNPRDLSNAKKLCQLILTDPDLKESTRKPLRSISNTLFDLMTINTQAGGNVPDTWSRGKLHIYERYKELDLLNLLKLSSSLRDIEPIAFRASNQTIPMLIDAWAHSLYKKGSK